LCLERIGEATRQAAGEALAPRVLGYWEGLAGSAVGFWASSRWRCWRRGGWATDAAEEEAHPDAEPDEAVAAAGETELARHWRRFGGPSPPPSHEGATSPRPR
jgi:hypothetical protein